VGATSYRFKHGVVDEVGICDGRKLDKMNLFETELSCVGGNFEGQTRFTDAANAGESDEAFSVWQKLSELGQLPLSTNESGQRHRKSPHCLLLVNHDPKQQRVMTENASTAVG
jgi:hypothetical protein